MRSSKLPLAVTVAGGAVLAAALGVVLLGVFATQDVIDVATLAVVVAALIGLYALRRHAREVLVYDRDVATSGSGSAGAEPDEPREVPTPFGGLTRRVWW
jgi:hypothetical protein